MRSYIARDRQLLLEGRPLACETLPVNKAIFVVGVILAATGLFSPAIALLCGLIFGLTLAHPFHAQSRDITKFLLQGSVVALGFGMNLHEVLHAGQSGFVYTAVSITAALFLGLALGHLIQVADRQSFLISAGTAICGGSAIAAVGPIAGASPIGFALHMSESQFGLWSALAIHDTSSVVGATAKYGPTALAIGTTIKLARALWIVPLAMATAIVFKSKARIQWPWFILFFCIAALLNTLRPQFHSVFGALNHMGKLGLTVTLFLIGASLNRETLRKVGIRPLLQGLTLWVIVGAGTLAVILFNWIRV